MGTFYTLKCPGCGYQIDAVYGFGMLGFDDDLLIKKSLIKQEADPNLQSIYNVMKEQEINQDDDSIKGSTQSADRNLLLSWPRVSADSSLYQCESCLHLFNHKRITIFTNKGKYIETYQYCPSCGRLDAGPVDEDEFKNSYNSAVEVCCPNCGKSLIFSCFALFD
ncbi:MAG: hypothetical protein J6E46_10050 [Faecalicoccus sp.]|nr:hypothetical protein [Faecalicoccus sp.]